MASPADSDRARAGAILTVDLSAVRDNYRHLRDRLNGGACAAVVKADAYGLGAARVAVALAAEGCATFFVAHAGEGLALRGVLGDRPEIYVLNGFAPGSESEGAAAGLSAVVNSVEQLVGWRAAAAAAGRSLPAAIQVDSGMARLGMPPADFEALAGRADAFGGLDVRLVMSHLACADEPDHPANAAQLAAFLALRSLMPGVPASLANSSGIFLGSDYHFDLARPGAALYGINPQPGRGNPMRQPVRLSAKVIQTRELIAGAGVGYGHAYRTTGPFRAATISLGYADGWPRRLSDAGAWFEGVRLPFAGRVSMDSIILDASALPPGRPAPGDLVELIGPAQTVDDIAALSGTIGYEILTGLGGRFHRDYPTIPGAGEAT